MQDDLRFQEADRVSPCLQGLVFSQVTERAVGSAAGSRQRPHPGGRGIRLEPDCGRRPGNCILPSLSWFYELSPGAFQASGAKCPDADLGVYGRLETRATRVELGSSQVTVLR